MLIVSGIISVAPPEPRPDGRARSARSSRPPLAEEGNLTYGFWPHPTEPGRVPGLRGVGVAPSRWGPTWRSDHMATFLVGMGELEVTGTELYQHEVPAATRLM